MKIFDLDGPFQLYGSMVFDIIVVNLMWLFITFFSFGILYGPATAAAHGSLYACVVTREGYMLKQFFIVFKKRILSGLLFGLISTFLVTISLFNLYVTFTGRFGSIYLTPVYLFLLIQLGFTITFAYPMLAHTKLKLGQMLKLSFLLANKHLPTAILTSLLNASVLYLAANVALGAIGLAIYLFAAYGIVFTLNSYLISKRVLTQYEFFDGSLS